MAMTKFTTAGLAGATLMLIAVAFLPMDASAQTFAAIVLLALLWICRVAADGEHQNTFRLLALVIGGFITLRYLAWRGTYTIHAADTLSLIAVLLLFGAEIYSSAIHFLGGLVNVTPLRRPLLSMAQMPQEMNIPTVDVMIPSYNEDPELLEVTLRAARMMRYPQDRVRIHLLDDGGTDDKIAHPNPDVAAKARERRAELKALCARLGVNYIARAHNERAKAGNINNALKLTNADLVVILDADHVPTVEFLDRTVPWFMRHDDVFLVQTPHFMVNPDPIDRNLLHSFSRMPSENDMFYRVVQRGLDFWGASFFCGSAAVLRRRHLDEVGGLCGDTITEDAETALALHSKGYRSIYIDRPMVAGLAPETFTGFVTQRMRWAQGMTQILLIKRPFMAPGLNAFQRIGYLSSILFWLFPFARVIFLTAPLAYLIFGMEVYHASIAQIIAYTLPHVIATYIIADLLFGRTRWPLISELYEVMQCLFSLVAVFKVIINPRAPSFVVTPKGATLESTTVSPLAWPFYVLFALILVGFAGGLYRWEAYPLTRDMTTVVMLWNLFNLVTVLAALGALLERQQRRATPRIPVSETGVLFDAHGRANHCTIEDLSASGAGLALVDETERVFHDGERLTLSTYSPAMARTLELPVIVRSAESLGSRVMLGTQFDLTEPRHGDEAVALSYGDSARWLFFQERRSRPIPFAKALGIMLRLVWRPLFMHVAVLSRRLGEGFGVRTTQSRPSTP